MEIRRYFPFVYSEVRRPAALTQTPLVTAAVLSPRDDKQDGEARPS